jgi:PIN domain nuclease of toxin-antitoxin system
LKLLLDTHLLLWAAGSPERLSRAAKKLIEPTDNLLMFSVASIWEVIIKSQLGREDFDVNARSLHRGLIDNGYEELPILSEHVIAVGDLPPIHKDPFDRLLIAQARMESVTLLTSDGRLAEYQKPVKVV